MSMYDYVSDHVELEGGRIVVHRYSILTTPTVIHAVYEAAGRFPMHTHGSIYTSVPGREGQPFGSYCSAELPAEIDALPGGSPERLAAATAWRAKRVAEAAAYIAQAFPYTQGVTPDFMGHIDMTLATIVR